MSLNNTCARCKEFAGVSLLCFVIPAVHCKYSLCSARAVLVLKANRFLIVIHVQRGYLVASQVVHSASVMQESCFPMQML